MQSGTILVCCAPFILLFHKVIIVMLFIALIGMVLKTNIIFSNNERNELASRTKRIIFKFARREI